MQTGTRSNLSSPEISSLWISYMQDNVDVCVYELFLSKVKDAEIRSLMEYIKNICEQRNVKQREVFNQEGLPIPYGFTKDDININAPALFTDSFYLWYINIKVYSKMGAFSLFLNNVSRPDLREYFSKWLMETTDIYNKDVDLLTAKGIFMDAPKVEILKEVTFVKENSFLGSLFGEQRSIVTNEVTAIYAKILYNIVSRALYAGFGQVAASKKVRDFMYRGRDMATKHIETLSDKLYKENVPVPSTSDSFITDSTAAPFSEKLMMFLALTLDQLLTMNDGVALVSSFRKDLQVVYTLNTVEHNKFSADGYNIMVENGWMEQPPQVVKSENLVKC